MSKDRQQDLAKAADWHVAEIAKRLGHVAQPVSDQQFGSGAMIVPSPDSATKRDKAIGVFEQAAGIRIRTRSGVDIRLPNLEPPVFRENDVLFINTAGDAALQLRNDGEIWVRLPAIPVPRESPVTAQEASDREMSISDASALPSASQDETRASDEPSPAPTTERKEKQPTVKLKGNVATPVRARPTPTGIPRVMFNLAEHPNEQTREETVYHFVYSIGDYAEKIAAKNLTVGEPVRISGYKQEYEHRGQDGKAETRERVFAVHVQSLKRKPATET